LPAFALSTADFGFAMGFSPLFRAPVFFLSLPMDLPLGCFAASVTTVSLSPVTASANKKAPKAMLAFDLY